MGSAVDGRSDDTGVGIAYQSEDYNEFHFYKFLFDFFSTESK